jgi:hypothetical protein
VARALRIAVPSVALTRSLHRDLVYFFPAVLSDGFDALELDRVRIESFLQSVVSDEEVAHSDV